MKEEKRVTTEEFRQLFDESAAENDLGRLDWELHKRFSEEKGYKHNSGYHLDLTQVDFQSLPHDLSGIRIEKVDITGANLSGKDLKYVTIDRAIITGAKFDNADLTKATLSNAAGVRGTRFREANLRKAKLKGVNLIEADFSGANLEKAKITSSHYRYKTSFQRTNFDRCTMHDAELSCSFQQCIFRHADLRGASVLKSSWLNSNMESARLEVDDATLKEHVKTFYRTVHYDRAEGVTETSVQAVQQRYAKHRKSEFGIDDSSDSDDERDTEEGQKEKALEQLLSTILREGNCAYESSAEDDFLYFQHREKNTLPFKESGWKIHINIHPEDIDKAWEATLPLFIDKEQGVACVKVLSSRLAGKREWFPYDDYITVYLNENMDTGQPATTVEQLAQLSNDVTKALQEAGIRPAGKPPADLQLAGNSYLSMRNDRNGRGEYIAQKEAVEQCPERPWNPGNYPNPYEPVLEQTKWRDAAQSSKSVGSPSRA